MSHDIAQHDATGAEPGFTVVGDGRLSDAAIEALARLLIDLVENDAAQNGASPERSATNGGNRK